jgi:hypothetical protein
MYAMCIASKEMAFLGIGSSALSMPSYRSYLHCHLLPCRELTIPIY